LWLWLEQETDLPTTQKGRAESVDAVGEVADVIEPCARLVARADSIETSRPEVSQNPGPKFLHIAPEVCLSKKFEKILPPDDYITADLESPLAKVHLDVQAIPFPDASFDIVFCNHVLEHVADDRLAMREMHRVMRPGGWGVMLSPVDETRAATFEDDTVTDRAERTRLFGQYDHRRVYGRDYADRLREAGWEVSEIDWFRALPRSLQTLHALRPETLYIVRKR
jgi:SAM-dependent methyltransferase